MDVKRYKIQLFNMGDFTFVAHSILLLLLYTDDFYWNLTLLLLWPKLEGTFESVIAGTRVAICRMAGVTEDGTFTLYRWFAI